MSEESTSHCSQYFGASDEPEGAEELLCPWCAFSLHTASCRVDYRSALNISVFLTYKTFQTTEAQETGQSHMELLASPEACKCHFSPLACD